MASDLRAQLQSSLGSVYTLERELGGGGMSRVFVAEETGRAPEARRVLAEVWRLGGASEDPAWAPAYLEVVVYAGRAR